MSEKSKIRVVSPWFGGIETTTAVLSSSFSSEEAEALLCDWAPSGEMGGFIGRKIWYCCEPACQFKVLGGGAWPKLRAELASHEFVSHNHPDSRFRVPHITHFHDLTMEENTERLDKAVAIVSNYGGNQWRCHPHIRFRNRFIVHPVVDLFGRAGWNQFRGSLFGRKGAPQNYRGEFPGDWSADGKRQLMAQYKVAVCLENMNEPHYFTEKFVEAVCAGCIPVYRADPSVAVGVLKGARWVDPASYGNDPERTLRAALQADATQFREANRRWLCSALLAETHHGAVFRRLAELLVSH